MLKKITDNVEIHQTLPDTPNLTTQELKIEWDKGCKIIKEAFNSLVDELNNNMFPIGFRMYVNSDKDYSNHLGFTWQKVAKGRVLVGKDENDEDFNTVGKTGGEKTHTLIIDEIPQHNHDLYCTANPGTGGPANMKTYSDLYEEGMSIYNTGAPTGNVGGNKPHNNMQPYEVVNIWERIL